jgi:hypothetical protein
MPIREFCQRSRLQGSKFYGWQRKPKVRSLRSAGRDVRRPGASGNQASFALVRKEAGATDVGTELVLGDGRRLRIHPGVNEDTLRSVQAALEPAPARC